MSYQYGTKCGPLRAAQAGGLPKRKSTEALSGSIASITVSEVDGNCGYVGVPRPGSNGGNFTINSNGTWTFDPAGDFDSLSGPNDTATTSVTYHASDGVSENTGTLTVTVSSTFPRPWTPADITTALWLDASDVASVSIDSGRVSTWTDKSGQGNHLSQTTPSYMMGYITGISVNGDSNSTFRFMTAPSPVTVRTIIMVFNWTDIYGDYRHVLSPGGYFHGNVSGSGRMFDSNYASSYVISGAGRINGTEVAPINMPRYTNKTIFSLVTTTDISLTGVGGWQESLGARSFYGNYHEIICSSFVLSAEEIQKTEGYLARKWDALLGVTTLVSALPSDHPYKSAAPTL